MARIGTLTRARLLWIAAIAWLVLPLFLSLAPQGIARGDVNDFEFETFSAVYELGRETQTGVSTLHVVETLVAVFPDADQNHGIVRAIPKKYRGLSTDIVVVSVSDGSGDERPFTVEDDGEFILVTSREDGFVHGSQTYVIEYRQSNVILEPDSGGAPQEFYWDVNGTGWSQSFGRVSARVIVPFEISSELTGDTSCYQGYAGDATPCSEHTSSVDDSGATTADFSATNLGPGQNLTVAIGFREGTFTMANRSVFASPEGWLFALSSGAFYALVLTLIILRLTRWANSRGSGIIVAEYGPPSGVTPTLAPQVFGIARRAVAAALVDLAVRGLVTLSDAQVAGRRGSFTVTRTGAQAKPVDQATLTAFFGNADAPGAEFTTKSLNPELAKRLVSLRKQAAMDALRLGWRDQPDTLFRHLSLPALVGLGIVMWLSGSAVTDQGLGGDLPVFALTGGWVAVVAMAYTVWSIRRLTQKGAEVRDSLRGLKLFIRLAEADRLRVLQSPEGALRVPMDTSDRDTILKVTEKVLPYAILFGLEDEWSKVLGELYSESSREPSWWQSNSAFNALVFSSSVVSFTQSTSSLSWAGTASSSSSGGSSGGGSSGGGGGGGGGGGV